MYLQILNLSNRNRLVQLFNKIWPLVIHSVGRWNISFELFSSIAIFLVPDECLNELEGVRHFEHAFQDRHPNVHRWPIWFKSTLENAINQSVRFCILIKSFYSSLFSMVHSLFFSIMMILFLLQYFLVKFFVHYQY